MGIGVHLDRFGPSSSISRKTELLFAYHDRLACLAQKSGSFSRQRRDQELNSGASVRILLSASNITRSSVNRQRFDSSAIQTIQNLDNRSPHNCLLFRADAEDEGREKVRARVRDTECDRRY